MNHDEPSPWAHGIVVAVGVMVLGLVATGEAHNYLRPLFDPLLAVAGALLVVIPSWSIVATLRGAPSGHVHLPRVSWLLLVPVLMLAVIAPGALGSYTADNAPTVPLEPQAGETVGQWSPDEITEVPLDEIVVRYVLGEPAELDGRPIRTMGFVNRVGSGDDAVTRLVRYKVWCCAADARPMEVTILDDALAGIAPGGWAQVEGHIEVNRSDERPALVVTSVTAIDEPKDPYL